MVARFDGGDITSDAGVMLLGAVEEQRGILKRFADCFEDHRALARIEHSCVDLISQRVLAIALGYEDVNDHERLKLDPLLASVVGKLDPKGRSRKRTRDAGTGLAAPSSLNRLELSHPGLAASDRYRRIALNQDLADDLLVDLYLEAFEQEPAEIILDFDATDDRVHGGQIGRHYGSPAPLVEAQEADSCSKPGLGTPQQGSGASGLTDRHGAVEARRSGQIPGRHRSAASRSLGKDVGLSPVSRQPAHSREDQERSVAPKAVARAWARAYPGESADRGSSSGVTTLTLERPSSMTTPTAREGGTGGWKAPTRQGVDLTGFH